MAENDRTPTRTAADKEKSRQQSRSVSGKQEAKSTTSSQPGKAKKPGQATNARAAAQRQSTAQRQSGQRPPRNPRPASSAPRRSPTTLLTWGTVALVVVIVLVFVLVKVVGGNGNGGGSNTFQATNATVLHEVTNIPPAVFDAVGVTATAAPLNPPQVLSNQPALKFGGLPGLFYYGAEFCPYCAAERWAISAALSRFGSLANLGNQSSSSSDVFPSTPTFTFSKATFTSSYIAAKFREFESTSGTVFQPLNAQENSLVNTYDSSKYVQNVTAGEHPFPFVDIGNVAMVSGAGYTPGLLSGLNQTTIAAGLSDSSNPVTREIVASANYISAAICVADHGQPGSVCNSSGVKAALKSLKLKIS